MSWIAAITSLNPPTPIPDDSPTGAPIPFAVTGVTTTTGLDVQVDVTHTFSGDVIIRLLRGTTLIKTLRNGGGGGDDDVKATYSVTPAELGTPLNADYTVRFLDNAINDTGTINLVKLTFKVN